MKTLMFALVGLASLAMASLAMAQTAAPAELDVPGDDARASRRTGRQDYAGSGDHHARRSGRRRDRPGAMRDDAARMTGVMDALRAAGVPDKDVQTSNISLQAQYTYVQNQPPKLTGYQASNDVTITVEELGKLGPVIDAVTGNGANQVSGISFGLKDPTAAEDQARLAAVKALQAKADLYAQATGYRIVRLVNLTEGAPQQSAPIRPLVMAAARAEVATPVSAGQLTVDVTISAVYELAR